MPTMPPVFRASGVRPKAERDRESDARRGSARQRGYTTAWDKAARGHLRSHPLCRYCELEGRVTAADLVDHVYPHRGDQRVFWHKRYWASCCTSCHSGFKQAVERIGRAALDALAIRLGLPILDHPPGGQKSGAPPSGTGGSVTRIFSRNS